MIDLGLTSAELRKYHDALAESRDVRMRARLLDRNERPLAELTLPVQCVLSSQINIDASGQWTRDLELKLIDRSGRFTPDANSPAPTAIWPSNFITVERRDWVEALDRYVSCPVFWGPLADFSREGDIVELRGRGKESMLLDPHVLWRTLSYPKGAVVVKVIRDILEAAGERRFDLPELPHRLPAPLSLSPYTSVWPVVQKLARSVNRQLFYDGRGRVRLRVRPSRPVFTFWHVERAGKPAPIVLTAPKIGFAAGIPGPARNTIEVLGPVPANAKSERVRGRAVAPRAHGLSPWSLSRNGVPRRLVERIENDKLKRNAEAQAIADRTLEDRLRIDVDVSFETLPVPHLEEQDLVAVVTEGDTTTFRLGSFTNPPTAAESMSVNALIRPRVGRRGR